MVPLKRSLSLRTLTIVAVGLTCAAGLSIYATILWMRSDAIHDAYRDNGNLATVIAGQLENSVKSIDRVLTEIQNYEPIHDAKTAAEYDRVMSSPDTHQYLKSRISGLTEAVFIGLIDSSGKLANTTQVWPVPAANFSQREHFRHFETEDSNTKLFIGNAEVARINGATVVFFSKRLTRADGGFGGVIVTGVPVSHFQRVYETIASLRDQSFLLLHSDGTVIVRYPDAESRAGLKMPANSPWYPLVESRGGHYRTPGYFDGVPRLVAVRPMHEYALVINVALSEDAALATWRKQAITIGAGAAIVLLYSALLLLVLSRKFNLLAQSERTVVAKARELGRANATLDVALKYMSQGLVMFDQSNQIVVRNERFLKMYDLPPDIVKPGLSFRELLDYRVSTGDFRIDDVDNYIAEINAAVGRGESFGKTLELRDGRIVSVVNQPIANGGWVATHTDVTEAKRAEERIVYAAHNDLLTGLPNRKLFYEQLDQALTRIRRDGRLAVLCLDLDHLKRVNDGLGHPIGDQLLKTVADRLRACIRETDLVARLGGDEFAIIQSSIEADSDAANLATRIREAITRPFEISGHQISVDISIGIAISPDDGGTRDELLMTGDTALYEAKNAGRGVYRFYQPEMSARVQARATLERDLKRGLANGEFEIHYQPVVGTADNRINSFEALLRWRHPERGIVMPEDFIPVAEEMGLIVPLGEWVIREACIEAATWPDKIRVAVNVSPIQLTSKNFLNFVMGALASANLRPDRLELEITESVFIKDAEPSIATLNSLHGLGVQVTLDDFGTGYSSLRYLVSFPFSKIKIDRSFVVCLAEKSECRAVVSAIAYLARSLNMSVVAEGVETEQQLAQIRSIGCAEMQGFLYSPARPAVEIHRFFLDPIRAAASTAVGEVA